MTAPPITAVFSRIPRQDIGLGPGDRQNERVIVQAVADDQMARRVDGRDMRKISRTSLAGDEYGINVAELGAVQAIGTGGARRDGLEPIADAPERFLGEDLKGESLAGQRGYAIGDLAVPKI